jgi:hypothetical protein
MKNKTVTPKNILLLLTLLATLSLYAQEQPPRKSAVELAAEQAERFEEELGLNHYQLFMVDSILQTNLAAVSKEFEEMQEGGMQNPESYRTVQKKWQKKTDDAFAELFTIEQFDRYLRITGVSGKERKRRVKELKEKREKKE